MISILEMAFSTELLTTFANQSISSPIGISLMLSILKFGATGKTWDELDYPLDKGMSETLLQYSSFQNPKLSGYSMKCPGAEIEKKYEKSLRDGLNVQKSDEKPCIPGNSMHFFETVNISSQWKDLDVTTEKGLITLKGVMGYNKEGEWSLVTVSLKDNTTLYVFIPDPEGDIKKIRDSLRPDRLRYLIVSLKTGKFTFSFPSFSYSQSSVTVPKVMEEVRPQSAFDTQTAQFDNISSTPLYANNATYSASITIDNNHLSCSFSASFSLKPKESLNSDKSLNESSLPKQTLSSGRRPIRSDRKVEIPGKVTVTTPFLFLVVHNEDNPIFSGWHYP